LDELVTVTKNDWVKTYQKDQFSKYFDEYDQDKNGYLSKAEIVLLMRQAFKKPLDH
jgi:Ca2+-binding EF-hand superfamily protein